MELFSTLTPAALTDKAKALYYEEREVHKVLNGWFLSKEIAAELKKQLDVTVDKKKIVLDSDIKAFGTYAVELKLYNGVTAKVNVMVTEA